MKNMSKPQPCWLDSRSIAPVQVPHGDAPGRAPDAACGRHRNARAAHLCRHGRLPLRARRAALQVDRPTLDPLIGLHLLPLVKQELRCTERGGISMECELAWTLSLSTHWIALYRVLGWCHLCRPGLVGDIVRCCSLTRAAAAVDAALQAIVQMGALADLQVSFACWSTAFISISSLAL